MQIIQSIREKGAAITVAVIVLCLIGFILMDAKSGSNKLFGSLSKNVGKVNGESVPIGEFNKRLQEATNQEEQRTQQTVTGVRLNQLREQVWNQIVAEKIFYAEAEKLGIDFSPNELSSILLSSDPTNPFMQQQGMQGPDGQLDMAKAQEALRNIKKMQGTQREAVNAEIINPLKLSSIVAKYSGMLNASAYLPKWMEQKEAADKASFAQISYVAIPYSEISDSAVTVTDADINGYVKKHKEEFKQEAGRMISYVAFSQLPNREDSLTARAALETLKPEFAADTNSRLFITRNTSTIDFKDDYLPKSSIQSSMLDSIVQQPVGTVYGPYVDNGDFVLAKNLGSKSLPDSVQARHILIATANPQTGEPIMADSTAKKTADSILAAVKSGANFNALALQYSADEGSKIKGGDLGTFGYGAMVPEFNKFVFTNPVGSKDVVRTQFGYHVIEVTSQKNFNPAYKIAFLGKEIIPSDVTINNASLQATKAASQKTPADLSKFAAENGVSVIQNPTLIKENDFSVGSLQDARALVNWAFDNKRGAISDPFTIGDQFVVATVDKELEEGLQDAETARSAVENIIRNEKKAEMIKKKIGANPTLQQAAAAYNKQVMQAGADSSITFASQIVPGLGVEPKLIGAAFNKAYQAKPTPVFSGNTGVYVMQVASISAKPVISDNAEMERSNRLGAIRSQTNNWFESLRKQATIKDNRAEMF